MMSTSRNCCLIARISERAINSMSKDALLHLSQLAPVPKKMEIEVLPPHTFRGQPPDFLNYSLALSVRNVPAGKPSPFTKLASV